MKAGAIAIGVLVALGLGALAFVLVDPFGDKADTATSRGLTGTACQKLAGLADQLAAEDTTPSAFIVELGKEGAGIHKGRRGIADLLRGGHNRILGRGFLQRYDDGTLGQVRHFVGISVATLLGGGNATRWISERLRDDPEDSPDGQLTDRGIDFGTAVLSGKLALADTGDWILAHLCRRGAV